MIDAISNIFPRAKCQSCLVHIARKLSHKVRVEDRQEVCQNFKTVYTAYCLKSGQEVFDAFCFKWQTSYPKVIKALQHNQHPLTFDTHFNARYNNCRKLKGDSNDF
ncbi:transposase [Bacillus cytotoxicus]|nr:hypothetical protein CG479_012640 [Bacillus cytotoxicus]NZD34210.1 transposase [Bacillus cytotoxicus]HDR7214114.1 transposase [Bacillus cytotoxicus]